MRFSLGELAESSKRLKHVKIHSFIVLKTEINRSVYFQMHQIPRQIEAVLRREFVGKGLSETEVEHRLKWCRFFVDFGLKWIRSPREAGSIPRYLEGEHSGQSSHGDLFSNLRYRFLILEFLC